jgi:hypothetical protein
MKKILFDITLRWSVHLISMKGLVVYILKKCKNKIIYIKYRNASSNILNVTKVKFRKHIVENVHFSLLEGLECDKHLNLILL